DDVSDNESKSEPEEVSDEESEDEPKEDESKVNFGEELRSDER
ncbi:hypothetical protein Tco_0208242, partial [Tanacetum coccineum]